MRKRSAGVIAALLAGAVLPGPVHAEPLTDQVLGSPPTTVASASVNHHFELVGYSPLGNRGNNAAIAMAGDCVYVGNRGFDDNREDVLVVDVSDPAAPAVVQEVAFSPVGATTRELRTSPRNNLLVVMTYTGLGSRVGNHLRLYDISDCRNPVLRSVLDLRAIRPHEFFLWEDPRNPARVIAYVTTPFGPIQLIAADLTDPAQPAILTAWEGAYPVVAGREADNSGLASYLHSLSISPDGRRGYLAYWDAGYYEIDTSQIADGLPAPVIVGIVPADQAAGRGTSYTFRTDPNALDTDDSRVLAGGNTHSAVPVPGRPLVALTDEAYDGAGQCPYGWFHLVDTSDVVSGPKVVSEYRLEQQTASWCDDPANITRPGTDAPHNATWSSHNLTLTENVALVAWHAGGLQAIDISNAASLGQGGSWVPPEDKRATGNAFRPRPAELGNFLGGHPVLMWSYPIIRDGLIYVLDIRNGLYVLRYTGPHAEEVASTVFREGNSNVTSYEIGSAAAMPHARPATFVPDLPQPATEPAPANPFAACLLP